MCLGVLKGRTFLQELVWFWCVGWFADAMLPNFGTLTLYLLILLWPFSFLTGWHTSSQRMGCTVWCEQKRRNRRKPTQNPKVTPKGHPKDNFRMLQNVGNHTFIGKRPEAFERGSMCRLKRPCVNLALASPYVSLVSIFGGFKHILFTQ